jgi:mannose-6-phosphate isomerase-like protein (cupin superfamily)
MIENGSSLVTLAIQDRVYGFVLRKDAAPDQTTFYSHPDDSQQVGHIVYKKGSKIPRHVHRVVKRQVERTTEVLLVQTGTCKCHFHDGEGVVVITVELRTGDVLCILDGAHSFEFLQDTVMLEVKQGPYLGKDEKIIL